MSTSSRAARGPLKVYVYAKCSTCRDALAWLEARGIVEARGIAHEVHAIRETPPTLEELRLVLAAFGGDLRKLFNTSGMDYRAMGMKDRLAQMGIAEALELLAANGNLVKRPFVIGEGVALTGFKPSVWEDALA